MDLTYKYDAKAKAHDVNRRWWGGTVGVPLHVHRMSCKQGKWALLAHKKEPEWFPSLKAAAVYLLCAHGMRLGR